MNITTKHNIDQLYYIIAARPDYTKCGTCEDTCTIIGLDQKSVECPTCEGGHERPYENMEVVVKGRVVGVSISRHIETKKIQHIYMLRIVSDISPGTHLTSPYFENDLYGTEAETLEALSKS